MHWCFYIFLYIAAAFCFNTGNGQFNGFFNQPSNFNPLSRMSSLMNNMKMKMNNAMRPLQSQMNKQKMANGMGGLTLISTGFEQIIIQNGQWYKCNGEIVKGATLECNGRLLKNLNKKGSPCFVTSYATDQNYICLPPDGSNSVNYSNINGQISCNPGTNSKTLFTFNEFKQQCGALPWEYEYWYYPDSNHPFRVDYSADDCQYSDNFKCVFQMNRRN